MGCAVLCQLGQALPVPISMPSEFLKGHAKNKRNLKICRLCSGGFFGRCQKKTKTKLCSWVSVATGNKERERRWYFSPSDILVLPPPPPKPGRMKPSGDASREDEKNHCAFVKNLLY